MIFYGLPHKNTAKPYIQRVQAHQFSTKIEKMPSKESVEKNKKEEPASGH